MKKLVKLFSYPGAKYHIVPIVNKLISRLDLDIYIEPFLGSGDIFLNLNKDFKFYTLNDISFDLMNIWNTFKEIDYELYKKEIMFIRNKFGDIGKDKEAYYTFRDFFNEKFYKICGKEYNRRGIYLHILISSCINHLVRFGPKGFSQSYGKRWNILSELDFKNFKRVLEDETFTKQFFFCNYNWIHIPNLYNYLNQGNVLFFMDPPYYNSQIQTYGKNNFNRNDLIKFLKLISNAKSRIIYTDILNEYNKEYLKNWNRISIQKNMKNVGPNKIKRSGKEEYLFYNFNSNKFRELINERM